MISVIIPALNEENYIENTLKSIKNSDYKDYEIIVVANGCEDKTVDKARKLADRIIVLKEKSASKARNVGASKAKGDILIFLDADTLVSEDTLSEIAISGYDVGTCKAKPDNNKLIARTLIALKNKVLWTKWSNGIIFCNKKIFEKIGGFREDLTKGEDGLFLRNGAKHGKYGIARTYVVNSMRRFEKWGYFYVELFWVKETLFPSKKEYPVVR